MKPFYSVCMFFCLFFFLFRTKAKFAASIDGIFKTFHQVARVALLSLCILILSLSLCSFIKFGFFVSFAADISLICDKTGLVSWFVYMCLCFSLHVIFFFVSYIVICISYGMNEFWLVRKKQMCYRFYFLYVLLLSYGSAILFYFYFLVSLLLQFFVVVVMLLLFWFFCVLKIIRMLRLSVLHAHKKQQYVPDKCNLLCWFTFGC